jgi:hypothetical protein
MLPPDTRKLGAAITAVWIDRVPVALEHASLASGFHAMEGDEERRWRWTDGAAVISLPLKPFDIQLDLKALFIASEMVAENS